MLLQDPRYSSKSCVFQENRLPVQASRRCYRPVPMLHGAVHRNDGNDGARLVREIRLQSAISHVWQTAWHMQCRALSAISRLDEAIQNTFPYEAGMYPSVLRQVEMKVLSNIFFRVAVCVPMAIRVLVAVTIR